LAGDARHRGLKRGFHIRDKNFDLSANVNLNALVWAKGAGPANNRCISIIGHDRRNQRHLIVQPDIGQKLCQIKQHIEGNTVVVQVLKGESQGVAIVESTRLANRTRNFVFA